MQLYKITNNVDGEDDPMFVYASDATEAYFKLASEIGSIPRRGLRIDPIPCLPEGEEAINKEN